MTPKMKVFDNVVFEDGGRASYSVDWQKRRFTKTLLKRRSSFLVWTGENESFRKRSSHFSFDPCGGK